MNMAGFYTKFYNSVVLFLFFNCYLAAPWPSLGHSQGDSLTKPILITLFELFKPEGYREPLNNVCSLGHAEQQEGFKAGTILI